MVSRFGTFHRPRRWKPLKIASSSVDGAGGLARRAVAAERARQVGADAFQIVLGLCGVGLRQPVAVVLRGELALLGGLAEQLRDVEPVGVGGAR